MNALDVLVVLLAVAALVGGWRLGFLARALSWVGLGLGLFLALRALPAIVSWQRDAPKDRILVLSIGVLIVGAVAGQALGLLIGRWLRPDERDHPAARGFDGVLGAVAAVVGVLAVVWLSLPMLAQTPGVASEQVRTSWVAGHLHDWLPDPPDSMQALRAIIGEDSFPAVFDALRPTPDLGPPPAATGLDGDVTARVSRSVVKVEGLACNRIQDGTGFVVAPGTVVTNAHVVAGETQSEVIRDDGTRLAAEVVGFDPRRDLALLRVGDLNREPLPLADSHVDATGGVFGHPAGGPLRIAPFKVAVRLDAVGRDIYGTGLARRQVLELSSDLRSGDSGSALVDGRGEVVGVAFAVAPDRPGVAYALDTAEVRGFLGEQGSARVSTGACTS